MNEVCNGVDGEKKKSNRFRFDNDRENIHNDDDKCTSLRVFNSRSNLADFEFSLGMHFPKISHLRLDFKDEYISGIYEDSTIIVMIKLSYEPNVKGKGANGCCMLRFKIQITMMWESIRW